MGPGLEGGAHMAGEKGEGSERTSRVVGRKDVDLEKLVCDLEGEGRLG
jgi:hypothetical protein